MFNKGRGKEAGADVGRTGIDWSNVVFIDSYAKSCYVYGDYTLKVPKCRENTPSYNRSGFKLHVNWLLN